jgi:hypothetical protein
MLCDYMSTFRWDTGVGRSSPIKPNSSILIENPLAIRDEQENLTKSDTGEFNLM